MLTWRQKLRAQWDEARKQDQANRTEQTEINTGETEMSNYTNTGIADHPADAANKKLHDIAKAIMEVDVADGCFDGRVNFIKEHLGREFVPNNDVVVVVKLPRSTDDYNDFDTQYLSDCPIGNWVALPEDVTFEEVKAILAESSA